MEELYQLVSYKVDVGLEVKLEEWERFYIFHRPHDVFYGNTSYEVLKYRLKARNKCSVRNHTLQATYNVMLLLPIISIVLFRFTRTYNRNDDKYL